MNILSTSTIAVATIVAISGCSNTKPNPADAATVTNEAKQNVYLPAPYETKSTRNFCKVIGWPKGKMPVAPAGFKVNLFAVGLDNPRNIYVAPNGDILVSQANTELNAFMRLGADII